MWTDFKIAVKEQQNDTDGPMPEEEEVCYLAAFQLFQTIK